MLKLGFPVTIAGLSTPRMFFPMILKSFGSFSFTEARSGTGMVSAVSASEA